MPLESPHSLLPYSETVDQRIAAYERGGTSAHRAEELFADVRCLA